jgi:hypothetical protein
MQIHNSGLDQAPDEIWNEKEAKEIEEWLHARLPLYGDVPGKKTYDHRFMVGG